EVVVTGTRIARRDYAAESPVVTLGQDAISATGQVTVDRALGQMPQIAAAQGLTEVGDAQANTGFNGGQACDDLRGLGPNRMLVGGDVAADSGSAVLASDYSERAVVHGDARPFFSRVRAFAFPQEVLLQPSGSNAPTITAVKQVLAGYPSTSPVAGTGSFPSS